MKILNFGSLNIDYIYKVDHFVKKGETLSSKDLRISYGGKGLNQSVALKKAGVEVFHAGMIGVDGTALKALLENIGVDTQFLYITNTVRTGNAIIQNDVSGDNCILLYGGANKEITPSFIDEVLSHFSSGDWLIVQNEISSMPYLIQKAHNMGMRVVWNPSPISDSLKEISFSDIDCFIVNEIEASFIAQAQTKLSGKQLAEQLGKIYPQKEIILTLGENGSVCICNKSYTWQPAFHVTTIDTTAAGDTFTGYYLASRFQNKSIAESLQYASAASALTVTKTGAALSIPEQRDVELFLKQELH